MCAGNTICRSLNLAFLVFRLSCKISAFSASDTLVTKHGAPLKSTSASLNDSAPSASSRCARSAVRATALTGAMRARVCTGATTRYFEVVHAHGTARIPG